METIESPLTPTPTSPNASQPTPTSPPTDPPNQPNPLILLRTSKGLSRGKFATLLQTSKPTVQFAELGCYAGPPIPYRTLLTKRHYTEYQEFRYQKRKQNFPSNQLSQLFPPDVTSLSALLHHLNLTPFQFADKICVQPAEVFRLLNTPSRQTTIPSNLMTAFIQLGVDVNWVRNFQNCKG